VAMIYVIRHPPEYNNVFLIESAEHGVDIHHLKKYFGDLKKHDIGIKRLSAEWFKVNKEKREELQRRIRGITLDQIDQEYDYNLLLRLALRFTRYLIFGTGQVLRRLTGRSEKKVGIPRKFQVRSFICSGFAQYAYFEAVKEAIARDGLPKDSLTDVVFDKRLTQGLNDLIAGGLGFDGLKEHLLSVIPKNFASSRKLDWIYFIRKGQVLDSPAKGVAPT